MESCQFIKARPQAYLTEFQVLPKTHFLTDIDRREGNITKKTHPLLNAKNNTMCQIQPSKVEILHGSCEGDAKRI